MTAIATGALPRSATTVYRLLAECGPLTHQGLAQRAAIPERTLRFAIARLRNAGLVDQRWDLRDARQSIFFLARGERPAPRPRHHYL